MTQLSWMFAVGFVAMAAVACSGPDVPVVENGSAEADGGTANQAGGSQTKGGTSGGGKSGASSTGGASGGTNSIGGLVGTGGGIGGGDAAGGTNGAAGFGGTSSGCQGQPPLCFGSDAQKCCRNEPSGAATCESGKWSCSGAAAPGCSGTQCTDQFGCGTQLECHRSTTYCAVTPTSADSADYACAPIPNKCLIAGASLCSCLSKDACTSCTESSGAVTLTCPP